MEMPVFRILTCAVVLVLPAACRSASQPIGERTIRAWQQGLRSDEEYERRVTDGAITETALVAVAAINGILNDPQADPNTRAMAASTLGSISRSAVSGLLHQATGFEEDESVRTAVVQALAPVAQDSEKALRICLDSEMSLTTDDPTVRDEEDARSRRRWAVRMNARLSLPVPIDSRMARALAETAATREEEWYVRMWALKQLVGLGTGAREVAPLIRGLFDDPGTGIADQAREVIETMEVSDDH